MRNQLRALALAGPVIASLIPLGGSSASADESREVASATRADYTDFRVMTWNIHFGVPHGGADSDPADIGAIAEVIRDQDPDVAVLNEVHRDEDEQVHGNQPKLLNEALADDGYEYSCYGVSGEHGDSHPGDGEGGNLVLSKFPISCERPIPLPTDQAGGAKKSMLEATLEVPGGGNVRLYATHLTAPKSADHIADQRAQARKVLDRNVIPRLNGPVLLAGDFNIRPNDTIKPWIANRGFIDTWTVVRNSAAGVTRPDAAQDPDQGTNKDKRIDYVFASPRFDVVEGHVPNPTAEPYPSDHLPVVMDVRVRGPEVYESGSVRAGELGEAGWAHLALNTDGRAKLRVCDNKDDGWSVWARAYDTREDEPYTTVTDAGSSRGMCQTTSWGDGYNPYNTALETCLVRDGEEKRDCRKHAIFDIGYAGARGEAGSVHVKVGVDNRVLAHVCDTKDDDWGVQITIYDRDPDNPLLEERVPVDGGCADSPRVDWDWTHDRLIAVNCLYRSGYPDRDCHTRELAYKR